MRQTSVESAAVVGLGKLGACLAASLANAGIRTTGADLDESVVSQINAGESPVPEPKMDEYVSNAGDTLRGTTDAQKAVDESDVTFIVVNTPSTENGRYSLDAVTDVCESVGSTLAEKDDYHVVVLTSTVFPGSTMGEVRETLERTSRKTAGEGFGLCYSPEFIAIGNVIEGLEDPDFFLVGEHTPRAGDVVVELYERLGEEDTPMARMPPLEAEITKMAINSYVTTKISYANTLAEICDGMGAHVDTVTDALTMDSRINGNYLSAGARYGGPCFPRDNVAFSRLAEDAGTRAPLAESTDDVNDQHTDWIAASVRRMTPDEGTVAILGMTYKPGTYIVEESQGVDLVESLVDEFEIYCYDPMGNDRTRRTFGDAVTCHESAIDALAAADSAVVTTPWDAFADVETYREFTGALVDPWRLFEGTDLPETVQYVPVGNGRAPTNPERPATHNP